MRLATFLPGAVVLAAAIGCAYAIVQFPLGAIHSRALAACVAAVALGLLTAVLLRLARVRRRGIAVSLGALVGCVGLWASWVAWLYRLFGESGAAGPSPVDLATSPGRLVNLIRDVNAVGVWRYDNQTYRGPVLAAIWVAEALALVLACVLIASRFGKPQDGRHASDEPA